MRVPLTAVGRQCRRVASGNHLHVACGRPGGSQLISQGCRDSLLVCHRVGFTRSRQYANRNRPAIRCQALVGGCGDAQAANVDLFRVGNLGRCFRTGSARDRGEKCTNGSQAPHTGVDLGSHGIGAAGRYGQVTVTRRRSGGDD